MFYKITYEDYTNGQMFYVYDFFKDFDEAYKEAYRACVPNAMVKNICPIELH